TWGATGGRRGPVGSEVTPRQRRADAVGLLAERALAAGFGGKGEGAGETEEEVAEEALGLTWGPGSGTEAPGSAAAPRTAEPVDRPHPPDPPLSGTRAERYQVLLHVDRETLAKEARSGNGAGPGNRAGCRNHAGCKSHVAAGALPGPGGRPGPAPRSFLEDGTRVSAETSRRLCCDAAVVQVHRGPDGSVLDVGRKTRTIPPALRRALEVRDGGCRFPGCGLRFTEGHHIVHWGDGGETKLSNLVLLCRFHHRAVHEEGFRVRMGRDGQSVRFFDPLGWPLPDMAPPPKLTAVDPVKALVQANRARGADPDGDTPGSRWERVDDMPLVIRAVMDEAVLEGLEGPPGG
ncbi:MAG: HNH endonuclease, partial [Gemmatimonadales bacterium]